MSIASEISYVLDCAFELGEITAIEEVVLRKNPIARKALANALSSRQHNLDLYLANTARDVLNTMPKVEQYFYAICGLPYMVESFRAIQDRAAHLVQSRIQANLGVAELAPISLYSELRTANQGLHFESEVDINEGNIRTLLDEMFLTTSLRLFEDSDLLNAALQWFVLDNGQEFTRLWESSTSQSKVKFSNAQELNALVQRQNQKVIRQEQKLMTKAKAAIKKATKLFTNLGQDDNLRLFVSGSEVTLSHPNSCCKLVVKPLNVEGWLIDRTKVGRSHTPYELTLLTKDDVLISKLCVFFKDTPVLDQLLALTFYVQSGNEAQILEKANWFATSHWTPEIVHTVIGNYPQLADKVNKIYSRGELPTPTFDQRFVESQARWEPFKGRVEQWVNTWFDPIVGSSQKLLESTQYICEQLALLKPPKILEYTQELDIEVC